MTSTCIYYIYKIVSGLTDKVYIGYTKNPEQRMAVHRQRYKNPSYNSALYSAMRKYGIDSFSMVVIVCTLSEKNVQLLEQELIRDYNSLTPNGYNIDKGGKGGNKLPPGSAIMKNKNTNTIEVVVDKTNGEYVGVNTGKRKIQINNKEYDTTETSIAYIKYKELLEIISTEKLEPAQSKKHHGNYKTEDGQTVSLPKNHPDVVSGKVKGSTKGMIKVRYFWSGVVTMLERDHEDILTRKCIPYSSGRQIPVTDGTTIYGSVCEAARAIGRDPEFIRRRIKLSIDGWKYATYVFGE